MLTYKLQSTSNINISLLFIIITLLEGSNSFGQQTPTPYQFQVFPGNIIQSNQNQQPANNYFQTPGNQMEQSERDMNELRLTNPELHEISMGIPAYNVSFPSLAGLPDVQYYIQALNQLNDMLNGKESMNIKKAVFIVENAYYGGQLDYNNFNNEIQNLIKISELSALQNGYDWKKQTVRNVMLFRAICDTLKVKGLPSESDFTSYPLRYDFDDYNGQQDWSKMFVSKLLTSKSGQCHSLPFLYLILAEETHTKAYLSFSPNHSYIRFKDQTGSWHNLEMTSGHVVTDAFIMGSGFIKSEALKSKIYMDTLGTKQTIAFCITDLVNGYIHKYGYDNFVNQCIDTSLKYYPNNISGIQIKANYYSYLFEYVVNQVNRPSPEILQTKFPKIFNLLLERNKLYEKIDRLGFKEMPDEAYQEWLKEMNAEKEKQAQKGQLIRLNNTLK